MMEEVNDDANGESTFEFVGSNTSNTPTEVPQQNVFLSGTSVNVPKTTPSTTTGEPHFLNMSPAAISGGFTSPQIPPPSALPVFSADPRLVSTVSSLSHCVPSVIPPSSALSGNNPHFSRETPPQMFNPAQPILAPQVTSQVQPQMSPDPEIPSKTNSKFIGHMPPPNIASPFPVINSPCEQPASTTTVHFADDYVSRPNSGSDASRYEEGGSSSGLINWIKDSVKGSEFLTKVAEKAKHSVDSVIFTLDPQMKDFMSSHENVNIIVASDKEVKVSSMKEAFYAVFDNATVGGIASQANIAIQPIGYTAGFKGAEERIMNLRQRAIVHSQQPIISIENFLLEAMPDKWFDIGCVILQDPKLDVTLHTYTQATPVSSHFIMQAQDATPSDYPLRWSGLSTSIGQIIGSSMNIAHTEWHEAVTGVSRHDILVLAGKVLAGQYKSHLLSATIPQARTM